MILTKGKKLMEFIFSVLPDRAENLEVFFLLGMVMLGLLNIPTYPYMPFNGILLTLYFIALSFTAVILVYHRVDFSDFYWLIFVSFNFAALFSRVFVNTSGIGTPKSTGTLGPVRVEQIWVKGIHLHHYWFGIILISLGFYMLRNRFSQTKTALVKGTGLALVVDELGILLAGHIYHSWVSYLSLAVLNTLLFVTVFRSSIPYLGRFKSISH
jgi:hypothetical protein